MQTRVLKHLDNKNPFLKTRTLYLPPSHLPLPSFPPPPPSFLLFLFVTFQGGSRQLTDLQLWGDHHEGGGGGGSVVLQEHNNGDLEAHTGLPLSGGLLP